MRDLVVVALIAGMGLVVTLLARRQPVDADGRRPPLGRPALRAALICACLAGAAAIVLLVLR